MSNKNFLSTNKRHIVSATVLSCILAAFSSNSALAQNSLPQTLSANNKTFDHTIDLGSNVDSDIILEIVVNDADNKGEGELYINGNLVKGFIDKTDHNKDGRDTLETLTIPNSYVKPGRNEIQFRHVLSRGYAVKSIVHTRKLESAPVIKEETVKTSGASSQLPLELSASNKSATYNLVLKNNPSSDPVMEMIIHDADNKGEGSLYVNGKKIADLFDETASSNDKADVKYSIKIPRIYLQAGNNALEFRHVKTKGYTVKSVNLIETQAVQVAKPTPATPVVNTDSTPTKNNTKLPFSLSADSKAVNYDISLDGKSDQDVILNMTIYDADNKNEGELYLNNNKVADLFAKEDIKNDSRDTTLSYILPHKYLKENGNVLTFRHVNTKGFTVKDIQLGTTGNVSKPAPVAVVTPVKVDPPVKEEPVKKDPVAITPTPVVPPETSEVVNLGNSKSDLCSMNSSNLDGGATYSSNISMKGSVIPGDEGIDVVLTPKGAVVASNSGSQGNLYLLNPATAEVLGTVSVSGKIEDMAYSADKQEIIISTSQAIERYNTSMKRISSISSGADRVAASHNGMIAALNDKTVTLYDTANNPIMQKNIGKDFVTDVEIMACGGDKNRIFVTSYSNNSFIDIQNKRNPVQIAALEAYNFKGDRQWNLFGHSNNDIKQNVADTRLYRVTIGQDGYLYIAGESAGTATIFRWNGDNPMTLDEQYGKVKPFVERVDRHNDLYNSGAAHITYYGRVNPATGELVTSQLAMPRSSNTKANTMRVGDIAATRNSTVIFGGKANASIAKRDEQSINGSPIGGYGGAEPTLKAMAPSLKDRHFWTIISAQPGTKGMVSGVDTAFGYIATVSNITSGQAPVTTGPKDGKVYVNFTKAP